MYLSKGDSIMAHYSIIWTRKENFHDCMTDEKFSIICMDRLSAWHTWQVLNQSGFYVEVHVCPVGEKCNPEVGINGMYMYA